MEEESFTTQDLIRKYVKKIAVTTLSLSKYIETGNKILDAAVSGQGVDTSSIECPANVYYGSSNSESVGSIVRVFVAEGVLRTCIEK